MLEGDCFVSHQQGKEFRFLYLWLEAMLKRVSQRNLELPAKRALGDGPACSAAEQYPWNQAIKCPRCDHVWGFPWREGWSRYSMELMLQGKTLEDWTNINSYAHGPRGSPALGVPLILRASALAQLE